MSNVDFNPADIHLLMKDISNQSINNESEGQLQQIAYANYTQLTIHKIWREMLGFSEFGLTDDLFDIGGDSVTAIQIFSEMNKVFGVRLTMEELFSADIFSVMWLSHLVESYLIDRNSNREILDYLIKNKVGIDLSVDGKLSIVCPKERRTEIQAFILQYRSEIVRLFKQDSKSLIVPLNDSNSTATPLFCIHAIAGTVYKYTPFARRLSGVCKVYGVQSCMFVDADWVNHSVPDMAARYVEQIRKIQPDGPYNLLGWSFGGIIAIEMAYILNELGEQVNFLGLIDTDAKTKYQPLNESELLENIHKHILSNFPGIDAGQLAESIKTLNKSTVRQSVGELIDHANLGSSVFDWFDRPPAFMFSRSFSVSFCQAYVDSILCLGDHGVSRISTRPFCWWNENKTLNERNVIKDVFGVDPVGIKIINEPHTKILNSEEFIDSVKTAIESTL